MRCCDWFASCPLPAPLVAAVDAFVIVSIHPFTQLSLPLLVGQDSGLCTHLLDLLVKAVLGQFDCLAARQPGNKWFQSESTPGQDTGGHKHPIQSIEEATGLNGEGG